MNTPSEKKSIVIVSDNTGRTAYRILEVTLSLFENPAVEIDEQYLYAANIMQIEAAVAYAARRRALVVFTLVVPELRAALLDGCRRHGLQSVDIIEPVLDHIAAWIKQEPIREAGRATQGRVEVGYFQRVMALNFALRHDDGLNADGLTWADAVLVGVSRTSKTPLTIFLAHRYGLRVGNVPLILNRKIPETLTKLPSNRVFGLYVNPDRLSSLREQREKFLAGRGNYADPVMIRKEIQYGRSLFTRHQWRQIDMTDRSIEEAAADIAKAVQLSS